MSSPICARCGSSLRVDSRTCPTCGASVLLPAAGSPGGSTLPGAGPGTGVRPYHPSHRALVAAGIAVVLVLVVVVGGVVWARATTSRVTITGAVWTIVYFGPAVGYFGASPDTTCQSCPQTVAPEASFVFSLTVTNHDPTTTHYVRSVGLNPTNGFVITDVPNLPAAVSPGGTVTVSVDLTAPLGGGNYVLHGSFETS